MKPIFAISFLTLSACVSTDQCDVLRDNCEQYLTESETCTCEAPALEREGDNRRIADQPDPQPEPPVVEPPKPDPEPEEPEPEGPKHPGKEPDRRTDPEGHHAWQERRDAYKAAGGIWP